MPAVSLLQGGLQGGGGGRTDTCLQPPLQAAALQHAMMEGLLKHLSELVANLSL